MIDLSHVFKFYGTQEVLSDITVSLRQGRITGLLGPNGAGKTTLVHILMGILTWDRGEIHVDGLELRRQRAQIQTRCSMVPQNLSFYPMLTAYENLEYFGALAGLRGQALRRKIKDCAEVGRLGTFLHKRADRCSGGMQRRLNLAIGLLNDPQILYLDEPTVGVDVQTRSDLLETIGRLNREEGKTILYTSHYLEEIEQIAAEIVIIDRGRIVLQGAKKDLLGGASAVVVHPDPLPEALGPDIDRIPSVRREGDHLTVIPGDRFTEDLAALFTLLSRSRIAVRDIAAGPKSLESLFLRLTGEGTDTP